jgi:hypothetical protein
LQFAIIYRQALAKQHWAEQHIGKLEAALAQFRAANPNIVMPKQYTETGEVTYYVFHVPAIPDEIPLIIGEALNSLRSALDYMACGMVVAGGGKVDSKTKFPIRKVAADWEGSVKTLVGGAGHMALQALRRIKPYETGNPLLWMLHTFNNIDKHRLLLTMQLVKSGSTLHPDEMSDFMSSHPGGLWLGNHYVHSSGPEPVPLKANQEIRTVPAAKAHEYVGFSINVSFGEANLPKGTPVELLLKLICVEVACVLRDLAPYV